MLTEGHIPPRVLAGGQNRGLLGQEGGGEDTSRSLSYSGRLQRRASVAGDTFVIAGGPRGCGHQPRDFQVWEAVRRVPRRGQGRPGGPAGRGDVSRGSGEREQVTLAEAWSLLLKCLSWSLASFHTRWTGIRPLTSHCPAPDAHAAQNVTTRELGSSPAGPSRQGNT